MLPYSLCRTRNQVYSSTHNHSRLIAIDGFLQRPQDLVAELVRKLEHWSHFSPYSLTMDAPPFLSLTTFPLYVLPNRPHSPSSLVFIVASSLT